MHNSIRTQPMHCVFITKVSNSLVNLLCSQLGVETKMKNITSTTQKVHSPNLNTVQSCILIKYSSENWYIIIIFHLSKLWKFKFFILCDVIFLVRLRVKFEIDHSWE